MCHFRQAELLAAEAGGKRGVDRVAQIQSTEIKRTMRLLGVSTIAELGRQYVKLS
jgi:isopentenyl diphosphate isomerase/L-lactate dehydrogenase-like FMN-dependent dehydrogenase